MTSPIIKAVDVGYGNTKYSVLASDKIIQCGIFPSIAPLASNGLDPFAHIEEKPACCQGERR